MLKRGTVIVLILVALLLVCSCKSEPELTETEEKTAAVGIYSAGAIIEQYIENGSYTGVSVKLSDDKTTGVFSFKNASVSVNLSSLDATWGTQTITVNGEVVMKYEAYPAEYPRSMTFNVSYVFGGKTHTLEVKDRETGVSSEQITFFKFDGKEYDASKYKL